MSSKSWKAMKTTNIGRGTDGEEVVTTKLFHVKNNFVQWARRVKANLRTTAQISGMPLVHSRRSTF